MRGDITRTWRQLVTGLRASWRPLLLVHFAYAALAVALLMPLIGLTVRGLLSLRGQAAVSDQDIALFILSPFGLVALVLVAGLVIATAAIEQAAMMAAVAGTRHGRPASWVTALRFSVGRVPQVLEFAWRLVARLLLIALPFLLAAGLAAWLLITDHDINFYLAARPPEFLLAAAIIAALFLVLAVVLLHRLSGWSLALPLLLFNDLTPRAVFRESERCVEGHRWHVMGMLLAWASMSLAIMAVVAGITDVIGTRLVPGFFNSLRMLVAVLGLMVVVSGIGALFAGAMSGGGLALTIMALHQRFGPPVDATAVTTVETQVPGRGWQATQRHAALVIIGATAIALAIGAWLLAGARVPDGAVVVAHRGAAGRAPENTLASVRAAIEDRADWVEIDVQETVDGEVVVLHDSDFMKLAGVPLKIWEGTLAEVTAIDVGSGMGPGFSGERVPTLAAVLDEMRPSPSRLVIELKYYGHDQDLERRVVELVERAGMAERVAIMSLKYEGIRKVRRLRPAWTVGLLAATVVGDVTRLDADFLAVNTGMASSQFIRHAHAAGKKVFVWTVNDPVTMSRMLSLGVDGVITDEPAMAREVLAERARLGTAERLLIHAAVIFGKPLPQKSYRDDSP